MMRAGFGLTAAVAALVALAGCGEGDKAPGGAGQSNLTATRIPAPEGGWENQVRETPEGGVLMGNPNAPVKVVEFASYTCPHCAEFAETGTAPLRDKYVANGNVSFELRPFLRNGVDIAVTLLAKCGGPQPFHKISEQMFASQDDWFNRIVQLPPAQQQQIQSLPPAQQAATFAQTSGLDQFVRQRGVPAAKVQQCLTDQGAIDRLVSQTNSAVEQYKVPGTPAFLINGELVEAGTWAELEPLIREELS